MSFLLATAHGDHVRTFAAFEVALAHLRKLGRGAIIRLSDWAPLAVSVEATQTSQLQAEARGRMIARLARASRGGGA